MQKLLQDKAAFFPFARFDLRKQVTMKKNRICALLLALAVCISLAACGESAAPASEPQKVSAPAVQPPTLGAAAPAPTETPEEPEAPAQGDVKVQFANAAIFGGYAMPEEYEKIPELFGTWEEYNEKILDYSIPYSVCLDLGRSRAGQSGVVMVPFPTPTCYFRDWGLTVGCPEGGEIPIAPHDIVTGIFSAGIVNFRMLLWNSTDEELLPNDPGVWVVGYEEMLFPADELPPLRGNTEKDVAGTFSLRYNPQRDKDGKVTSWNYASVYGALDNFKKAFGEPTLDTDLDLYRYEFDDYSIRMQHTGEGSGERITALYLYYDAAFRDMEAYYFS